MLNPVLENTNTSSYSDQSLHTWCLNFQTKLGVAGVMQVFPRRSWRQAVEWQGSARYQCVLDQSQQVAGDMEWRRRCSSNRFHQSVAKREQVENSETLASLMTHKTYGDYLTTRSSLYFIFFLFFINCFPLHACELTMDYMLFRQTACFSFLLFFKMRCQVYEKNLLVKFCLLGLYGNVWRDRNVRGDQSCFTSKTSLHTDVTLVGPKPGSPHWWETVKPFESVGVLEYSFEDWSVGLNFEL